MITARYHSPNNGANLRVVVSHRVLPGLLLCHAAERHQPRHGRPIAAGAALICAEDHLTDFEQLEPGPAVESSQTQTGDPVLVSAKEGSRECEATGPAPQPTTD